MREAQIKGKTVLLGITASVAAYKAPEIARRLIEQGDDVHAILTPQATNFIGPTTLEALTCNKAPFEIKESAKIYFEYLELAKKADLILVAPATANFIALTAAGLASNLLSTLVLARKCPLLVAPAMNERMWQNEITQDNVRKLKKLGVTFIDPEKGDLACGDEGVGRLADIENIIDVSKKITG